MIPKNQKELERLYENKEPDNRWFQLQSALGTEENVDEAFDENGNFRRINWFSCGCCPAARAECFA